MIVALPHDELSNRLKRNHTGREAHEVASEADGERLYCTGDITSIWEWKAEHSFAQPASRAERASL